MVIDCSVSVAWYLRDESAKFLDDLLKIVERGRENIVVPRVWAYEVHSAFCRKIRQERCTEGEMQTALKRLANLPITIFPCWRERLEEFTDEVLVLVERHNPKKAKHGLQFFDALYLDLAIREQVPLATLDGCLVKAASAEGVRLVVPPDELRQWHESKAAQARAMAAKKNQPEN